MFACDSNGGRVDCDLFFVSLYVYTFQSKYGNCILSITAVYVLLLQCEFTERVTTRGRFPDRFVETFFCTELGVIGDDDYNLTSLC